MQSRERSSFWSGVLSCERSRSDVNIRDACCSCFCSVCEDEDEDVQLVVETLTFILATLLLDNDKVLLFCFLVVVVELLVQGQ